MITKKGDFNTYSQTINKNPISEPAELLTSVGRELEIEPFGNYASSLLY